MMELNEIKKAEKFDKCPYCGGDMFLNTESDGKRYFAYSTYNRKGYDERLRIFFECEICASRSPYTTFRARLLDEDLVKAGILRTIDSRVREATYCNIDEEDSNDDEE